MPRSGWRICPFFYWGDGGRIGNGMAVNLPEVLCPITDIMLTAVRPPIYTARLSASGGILGRSGQQFLQLFPEAA